VEAAFDPLLLATQEERETRALRAGQQAFRAQVRKATESQQVGATPAAILLIDDNLDKAAQAIQLWVTEQTEVDEDAKRRGKRRLRERKKRFKHFAAKWLDAVGSDVAAYITFKTLLDYCMGSTRYLSMTLKVANRIIDELYYRKLKDQVPELLTWKLQQFSTANYEHMQRSLDHTVRTMLDEKDILQYDMTVQRKAQLGGMLIDWVMKTAGDEPWFEMVNKVNPDSAKRKTENFIRGTSRLIEWMLNANEQFAMRQQTHVPMVVPPRDWGFHTKGGYHFLKRAPMVRKNGYGFEYNKPEDTDLPLVYQALNALQRTAWTINKPMYEQMEEEYSRDLGSTRPVIPARPENADEPGHEAEEKAWRRIAAKKHNELHDWKIVMQKRRRVLDIAKDLIQFDRFYYPYSLDFRGRIYPISDFLHPQGEDTERALLKLADTKEITDANEGVAWLAVHGANCFGTDGGRKLSRFTFGERVEWVAQQEHRILASAAQPSEARWWTEADDPWQFLAFCREWASLLRVEAAGERFSSGLPIHLDGTCNGLQHFSAMFRDEIGGAAVNVAASPRPEDIYQRVADRVLRLLEEADDPLASRILALGIVDRKLAKRPTMTFGYGSRVYRFKRVIRAYFREHKDWPKIEKMLVVEGDKSGIGMAAAMLANFMWQAIGEEVVKAAEAMVWFRECAKLLPNSAEWTVPITGLPVQQGYKSVSWRRVETTLLGKMVYTKYAELGDTVDKRKQVQSIAPNVIHSLDAAALMLTIKKAQEAGIEQFAMVHDSYGTLAADVKPMRKATREAFVELYSHDVVRDLQAQWQKQTAVALPEPPETGSLNLNDVLRSEYFFA
jgi:Autographiviridae RNA polymerase